jgi:predicted amidophosphoribosyltransferase
MMDLFKSNVCPHCDDCGNELPGWGAVCRVCRPDFDSRSCSSCYYNDLEMPERCSHCDDYKEKLMLWSPK